MIKIICVGSIKEKFTQSMIDEYTKRLRTPYQLSIIELKESKHKNHPTMMVDDESEMILKQISTNDYVVALDILGQSGSTQDFHQIIESTFSSAKHCVFIIGGSHGFNDLVRKRANECFSLSRMTFPHQLVRVLLIEQIYRSYTLYQHIPYDK
jgi:23S rRNA (pseudouridine1915-N3)-methyltransferase